MCVIFVNLLVFMVLWPIWLRGGCLGDKVGKQKPTPDRESEMGEDRSV